MGLATLVVWEARSTELPVHVMTRIFWGSERIPSFWRVVGGPKTFDIYPVVGIALRREANPIWGIARPMPMFAAVFLLKRVGNMFVYA